MSDEDDSYDPPIPPAPTNSPASNLKDLPVHPKVIHIHTETCQHLIEEAISNCISFDDFINQLNKTGISPVKAQGYVDQFVQQCSQRGTSKGGG
jgi:hypothetical protein